ncbi:MAG: regulatory iron-sulfur-containing complex subunit RicT, partial [Bacteroidota bacterium]
MGCSSCGSRKGTDGKPLGCNSNGGCATGGCNRLNTYDWLAVQDIYEPERFDVVEVSFKNGSRKSFYKNPTHTHAITGDMVVVDTGNGYDVGRISLSGELVRMQMKKKRVKENTMFTNVIRRANDRDMEKLTEARNREHNTMVRARVIARTLALEMKIGDVEYQGDKRKATFYYTAEGRVDFRELIRHYAKEFKVKIEMRQIGARQESARIGGLGSCGRELCCSTWLSDFKSVSTAAARYQNLAINQSKLSGQCGRLKCCLNYELDSYMDALKHFPKNADNLFTEVGKATLVKTDIFKGIMYYAYFENKGRGKFYPVDIERVKEIQQMNKNGEKPTDLIDLQSLIDEEMEMMDYEDVTGVIELPMEERRRRRRNRNRGRRKPRGKENGRSPSNGKATNDKQKDGKGASAKSKSDQGKR